MKKLIAGITSAVATYILTRKSMNKPESEPEWEWVDGDDEEIEGPAFLKGDTVVTWNPYVEDYAEVDWDFSPLFFKVEKSKWDETDECYRYKLEGNDRWYAESWLMAPEYPMMTKLLNPSTEPPKKEVPIYQRSASDWSRRADELLDQYNALLHAEKIEESDQVMRTFLREQALFKAGEVIREVGGELGGVRE